MTKKQSTVASERVADIIAGRIHNGEMRPGERLKQGELARELGVSRIPVRDALRILDSRGMVAMKTNAGARVVALSAKDMEMSYRIRERLEPMLLADSIPGLMPHDLEAMADIKSRLEAVSEIEEYMSLSRDFHWTSFCGHSAPLLAQIVERLWDTTQIYRRTYASLTLRNPERLLIMHQERDMLFGAIRRRETDLAPMILAQHIRRARKSLLQHGMIAVPAA